MRFDILTKTALAGALVLAVPAARAADSNVIAQETTEARMAIEVPEKTHAAPAARDDAEVIAQETTEARMPGEYHRESARQEAVAAAVPERLGTMTDEEGPGGAGGDVPGPRRTAATPEPFGGPEYHKALP